MNHFCIDAEGWISYRLGYVKNITFKRYRLASFTGKGMVPVVWNNPQHKQCQHLWRLTTFRIQFGTQFICAYAVETKWWVNISKITRGPTFEVKCLKNGKNVWKCLPTGWFYDIIQINFVPKLGTEFSQKYALDKRRTGRLQEHGNRAASRGGLKVFIVIIFKLLCKLGNIILGVHLKYINPQNVQNQCTVTNNLSTNLSYTVRAISILQ